MNAVVKMGIWCVRLFCGTVNTWLLENLNLINNTKE